MQEKYSIENMVTFQISTTSDYCIWVVVGFEPKSLHDKEMLEYMQLLLIDMQDGSTPPNW